MKHGKYYATGLVVLLLIGGGTGLAVNHNNSDEAAETHKSVKSSSSSSHKEKKSSVKKSSSKNSSESSISKSEVSSSQSETSSSTATDDTTDSGFADVQPTSNTTLTAFLNKYGITPAQWLVQNKGMSIEDALYATPDEQETSGELQSEWAYKQGTHDQMVADNDAAQSSQDEEAYWTSKAWEPNADYYGDDGSHYQNDDQGNTYDADTGMKIGKGSNTVGMNGDN